jgi:hypothetical protein
VVRPLAYRDSTACGGGREGGQGDQGVSFDFKEMKALPGIACKPGGGTNCAATYCSGH